MRVWIVFLVSVFLLQSCMKVGPDFSPPNAPCKWGWMEEVDVTDAPICCWWQTFNDPILNNLIETATEQNLSLQIACFRIQEARARLGFAYGNFYPQTQQGFGLAKWAQISKHQPNSGPAPDLYFKDYQLGLQAAWELDFWGKFRRAIESENAALLSSYANYDDVLVLLLADVASTYIDIRTFEELNAIIRRNIQIQARSLEIVSAQFRGGFVSELDVQQAKTLLKDTEGRLPDIERQKRQAENALCVLLGVVPQDLDCLLGWENKIPNTTSKVIVNLPEDLLCRRPDIRQSYYDLVTQNARIGIAKADFFPQISLTGVIGFRSGDSALDFNQRGGSLIDRDSLTFDYGTNFAWPILNYGRISSRVDVEQALFCQLLANYKQTVLQAYQEVEDGLVSVVKTEKQEELLIESVAAATRSVELSRTQYVEGMVDYTRVLNTQQALLAEEESLAISRGNLAKSFIAVYKALGGGW